MSLQHACGPLTRPATLFSQTVQPFRVVVLDQQHCPISLGIVRARHSFAGTLTGYYVELDDGSRMDVTPAQIGAADNIIAPPAAIWNTPRDGLREDLGRVVTQ